MGAEELLPLGEVADFHVVAGDELAHDFADADVVILGFEPGLVARQVPPHQVAELEASVICQRPKRQPAVSETFASIGNS